MLLICSNLGHSAYTLDPSTKGAYRVEAGKGQRNLKAQKISGTALTLRQSRGHVGGFDGQAEVVGTGILAASRGNYLVERICLLSTAKIEPHGKWKRGNITAGGQALYALYIAIDLAL
jgi:hypothetical protein